VADGGRLSLFAGKHERFKNKSCAEGRYGFALCMRRNRALPVHGWNSAGHQGVEMQLIHVSATAAAGPNRAISGFIRRLSATAGGIALVLLMQFAAGPTLAARGGAPVVAITAPTAGATVGGMVAVAVTATDNRGIARVELFANSASVGIRTTAPYSFSWDSTRVANGSVSLTARATDSSGNTGIASTSVTVSNTAADVQPPAVTLTAPAAGSTLTGTVAVTTQATDNVGISRVDLLVNGTRMASASAAPFSFQWDTTTVENGTAMLSAVAYDAAGNTASAALNTTVSNTTTGVTTQPTLTVTATNAPLAATVRIYPADAAGLADGAAALTRSYATGSRVWLSAPLRSGNNYFVKWQRDGVDYDNASTTTVLMDASHALTAVYQTPACSGIAVYAGTNSLKNAVANAPAGSTFCIKAGVHRFTTSVVARTADKFIGEPGAVLNGAKIVSSFTRNGAYWIAGGQTQQQPTFAATLCASTTPSCIYPEKVFINNVELRQVSTLAELSTGEFYFDYAADQIYLVDDPTGKTVEATTGSGGIVGYSGGSGDSVTVKNLVFEKFGGGSVTASTNNALKSANGWRIENNEFRFISYIAVANYGMGVVRNNYIHHNGQYGILGTGTFEGNIIASNNTDGFNPNNDSGGSKFLRTNGLIVRGNIVASNVGRGFWTDYDNINTTYENNIVENNTEMGIYHEVSCAAVIRNNVVRGNNAAWAGKSLWYGGQIYTRSSRDVQIYGNHITASGGGTHAVSIRGGDAPYTTNNCGILQSKNVAVHDNVIRLDATDVIGVVGGYAGYGAAYNIRFSNNVYYLANLAGTSFLYDGATRLMTKEQWQGAGQDITGRFLQLP